MSDTSAPSEPHASVSSAADTPGTPDTPQEPRTRRDELTVFLIICVVLFPALTVALMGFYGLIVWISHMLGG